MLAELTPALEKPPTLDKLFRPSGHAKRLVRRLAERICRVRGFSLAELDDVHQELSLAVVRRWPTFDPAKSSWKTFVESTIRFHASDLVRRRGAAKRNGGVVPASLDNPCLREAHPAPALRQTVVAPDRRDDQEYAAFRHDLGVVLARLPARLRKFTERLLVSRNPDRLVERYPQYASRLRQEFALEHLDEYLTSFHR